MTRNTTRQVRITAAQFAHLQANTMPGESWAHALRRLGITT